jgi:thioredoxin 1
MWAMLLILACGSAEPTTADQAIKEQPAKAKKETAASKRGSRRDVEFDAFMAAYDKGVQLVDVRTQAEYDGGHVPGALHVPLVEIHASHPALAAFDMTQDLYLVCEVGGRSGAAADKLAAQGWRTVNVQGGTKAWRKSGKPLE